MNLLYIIFYLHSLIRFECIKRKFHKIIRRQKNDIVNNKNNSMVELATKGDKHKFGGTDERCKEDDKCQEKQEYEKIANIFMNKRKLDFLQNKYIKKTTTFSLL